MCFRLHIALYLVHVHVRVYHASCGSRYVYSIYVCCTIQGPTAGALGATAPLYTSVWSACACTCGTFNVILDRPPTDGSNMLVRPVSQVLQHDMHCRHQDSIKNESFFNVVHSVHLVGSRGWVVLRYRTRPPPQGSQKFPLDVNSRSNSPFSSRHPGGGSGYTHPFCTPLACIAFW